MIPNVWGNFHEDSSELSNYTITVEQIGGYVGYSRKRVTQSDMAKYDQTELENLVNSINVDLMKSPTSHVRTNNPSYNVIIESEGTREVLGVSKLNSMGELRELIDFVRKKGKVVSLDSE